MLLGRRNKQIPASLGTYAISIANNHVSIYNLKQQLLLDILPPVKVDQTDTGEVYLTLASTVYNSKGQGYQNYWGIGTTITQTYTGPGRTVTRTIAYNSYGISTTHSVTYSATTQVYREGSHVATYQPLSLMADQQTLYNGSIFATDDGDVIPNFIINPDNNSHTMLSWNTRTSGTTRTARIQIPLGTTQPLIPMLQPSGYLATLIFTNHPDGAWAEDVAALMYGASDQSVENQGFIGLGVKTTWAFFTHSFLPSSFVNSSSSPLYITPVDGLDNATPYHGTSTLLTLAQAMEAAGQEVVPHRTRSQHWNTRQDAVNDMYAWPNTYGISPVTWIDHGEDAGARNIGVKSLGSLQNLQTTLYAACSAGATSFQTNAAMPIYQDGGTPVGTTAGTVVQVGNGTTPGVGDMEFVTIASCTGSSAPYTCTLQSGQSLANSHSSGELVSGPCIMDLMQNYGYKYLWSYIDMPLAQLQGINMMQPGWVGLPWFALYQNTNIAYPNGTPLWQFTTWRQGIPSAQDGGAGLLNTLTDASINNLISSFGLSINHDYYSIDDYDVVIPGTGALHWGDSQNNYSAGSGNTNGDGLFYNSESITPSTIAPNFEAIIVYVAAKISAGTLWNPTLSQWANYFVQLTNVTTQISGTQTYTVTNNNTTAVTGFAMRAHGSWTVKVNGSTAGVTQLSSNGYTVFYFNMAASTAYTVTLN